MQLPDNLKRIVVDEMLFAASEIERSSSLPEKIYLFSAAHGIVNRVFNLHFDADLVLVHQVLSTTHAALSTRLTEWSRGINNQIPVVQGCFDSLPGALRDLSDAIEKNSELSPALRRIALLGYVATGNGYYLYRRGAVGTL